ncbi:MAG: thioredoxin domain-containing protein [Thermoplasmata archaeon]|nr:thioredoxin domain-containing protein [Thermoplasmata archaeon]
MSTSPLPASGRPAGWRLAERPSQYLRSAAGQANEWHPWGEEPFALAKRLNRPIRLDIGAAWCHWCHVMDEGTYSDAEVARLLAQHFVAVKVDRDEHPEVDRRYQRQVGALTGEGGWPLTAFLTPDGEAFLGGTYFPAQDGMGRPGLRRVLGEVARIWKDDPAMAQQNVAASRASLARVAKMEAVPSVELGKFTEGVLARIDQSYDPVHSGFGQQPKFPHPTAVRLYLWHSHVRGDDRAGARARETLRRMAEGGMYDQIGGGFHRYSVDEGWHVPHFEKMAQDNAALLVGYVEGAQRFGEPIFDETIRGTVAWSMEVLGDRSGGFASSQDADNAPGDDGGYFTWSRPELKQVLDTEELRLASRYFGVGTEGRMHHDPERNVLYRLLPIEEVATTLQLTPEQARGIRDRAISKLRSARARRSAPAVDRALYASLNGGYIQAFALAGRYLGDPIPLATARAAADRFLDHAYAPDVGVAHRLEGREGKGYGLLEDQVEFGLGLAELAAATRMPRYVEAARGLADLSAREFHDDSGLLRDIAPRIYDGPMIGTVGEASFPLEDHPHLSANAGYVLLQLRLAALTGDEARRVLAQRSLAAMAPRIASAGIFAGGAALAAGLLETPAARVIVEGTGPSADALWTAAERTYHPRVDRFRGVPPAPFSLPEELSAASGDPAGPVRALVCFGTRCLAPITEPAELRRVLSVHSAP